MAQGRAIALFFGMNERYGKRDDDRWVEDDGLVVRVIPDDVHGSRHQRFVVRLRGGQTLLVAHNLELAERVPVGIGDKVRFRGIYEWSEEGGTLHWTHNDPHGMEAGGYVDFRSRRYD
jgi:hypothetical protein